MRSAGVEGVCVDSNYDAANAGQPHGGRPFGGREGAKVS